MKIFCRNCKTFVIGDPTRTVGCSCDSDSPTWVAIIHDERVLKMSYASISLTAPDDE